ncbi:hypothetical protein BK706_17185 [Bacillus thuringiensis serovar leesis]|nr:hypothetical protein BK706_17185 [Bacillus thuringiensis serovar leesis]
MTLIGLSIVQYKVGVAARADDKAILKLLGNDFREISIEETRQIGESLQLENDIKCLFFFLSSQNKRILFVLRYLIIFT